MYIPSKISIRMGYTSLFYCLVFFYFFTLCGDYLNVKVTLFKFKLNNLLAVLLLAALFLTRRFLFAHRSVLLPSLYILGSIFLSTLFGVYKYRSAGYLLAFVFEFGCYFLVPFNLMYQCNREKVFTTYIYSYKCLGVYAILQLVFSLFGIYDPFIGQWIAEGIARPNTFAYEPSYYALCISSFVMFYNVKFLLRDLDEKKEYSFSRFVLINLFLLISTSTGGFMAYFVFIFICIVLYRFDFVKKYSSNFKSNLFKMVKMLVSLMGMITLISVDVLIRYFLKFFILGRSHSSFGERWRGISYAWDTFLENPILGVGLGGVGPYLHQKHFGADVKELTLQQIELLDPTNVLTEVLASLGIVGALGFILLGIWVFRLFKEVINSEHIGSQDKRMAIALFISLVIVMIQLQFSQGLFRNYIWAHTGIVCGYLASLKKEYAIS